ncbi:MAG: LysM peptidoglycan-binding domain-containing protein [Bacteroidales bacterium]|nr:LysM peptidoglycan-binding domain-containing protein [Bacteroidales bacterium]
MYNSLKWSNIVAVVFSLFVSLQLLQAQEVSYETTSVDGQTYYKYRVQPGEGLYAISRTFSVSVAEILRHNPDANTGLQSGQELLIPVKLQSTAPANASTARPAQVVGQSPVQRAVLGSQQVVPSDQNITFNHTVVSGETVYSISKMYNTTVEEIYRLNPSSRESIAEGQILVIPQRRVISEVKEENYRYHTILPKETLYSLSRTYSLKPEDVIRANPGLSVETFQIGKTIRIPFFESYETILPFEEQTTHITHRVARGETLYSLAREYNVEVAEIRQLNPMLSEGLKTNMELLIPAKRSAVEGHSRQEESAANRLLTQGIPSERVDVMKVGLLLPFLDETGRAHLRLQEYYEGFLLAVKELKKRGGDIELFVFEIGKGNDMKKLSSLLETLEMQSLNLIVGGVNDAQIKLLSDFSRSHDIKYVVPFSQSNGEVLNNGNVFQVNSLSQALQSKASKVFLSTFRNANVIFVRGGDNDKAEFVSQLQNELRRNNIRYETVNYSSTLNTTLNAVLYENRENIIVPTDGDSNTLRLLMDQLKEVQEANSSYTIRLFGYPEWQTYSSLIEDYHLFGTYIYTPFFVESTNPSTRDFNDTFQKWYGRMPMDTYPGYAMWGYDTALFFLSALQRYGAGFEQQIDRVGVESLQFAFHFERMNNWGGFINTGLFLIHYDPNGNVIKMDKSR